MSVEKNQYGLSRDIPDPIKRQIRQASGFGCVVCGGAIITYEHVDPVFVDAHSHEPDCITLLCPTCHGKVTSKFMSKATVKEWQKEPYCRRVGYSSELLDVGRTTLTLVLGGATFTGCPIPIMLDTIPLIRVQPPESLGAPIRVSATFFNSVGEESLQIIENEWRAFASNWDVEVDGGSITIREGLGDICLRLVVDPPDRIIVDRLNMLIGKRRFIGGSDKLTITQPNGAAVKLMLVNVTDCAIGVRLN